MVWKNHKVFEFGVLAVIMIFVLIFWIEFGENASFCFIFGNIWGFIVYKILMAREYFMMNRFRNVLRQYAGLNHPAGDQAREVLQEEKEG